ncbi:hypothetical protein M0R45_030053 [Rubus argutus]|uniref:Uncharacterized protein n=1 Tax=Rubus argutus TaxID=59490 RepID=A0AAW1WAA3_RUBAR
MGIEVATVLLALRMWPGNCTGSSLLLRAGLDWIDGERKCTGSGQNGAGVDLEETASLGIDVGDRQQRR